MKNQTVIWKSISRKVRQFFLGENGQLTTGIDIPVSRHPKLAEVEWPTISYTDGETIYTYFQTGGDQPETTDPKAIDLFFIENYAKVWAMNCGYIAKFIKYENQTIHFKLISDPRWRGNDLLLAMGIAKIYQEKVNVLSDAREFTAVHHKAVDVIGGNASLNDPVFRSELMKRVNFSYATLSDEPWMIHYGVIKH